MALSLLQKPKSIIEITGEVSADVFSNYYNESLKKFSDEAEIKGFRRGNAPKDIVEKHIGEQKILETAAQAALEIEYPKILRMKKIRVIGNPSISITKLARGNPLGFTITAPTIPVIKINNYAELAKEACLKYENDLEVTDDEVGKTIELIKKSQGDKFNKAKVTPETVRRGLVEDKKRKNIEKKRITILEAIIKEIKTDDIPDIMVDSEKHKLLHETKNYISNMGMKWEEYLKHIKKSEEELLAGLTNDAIKRVKFSLVLDYIAEKENITAPDGEVLKETERIMEQAKNTGNTQLDKINIKGYTKVIIQNEKVLQYLEKLC